MKNIRNKKALISIIVPVYNSERYISDCLESILMQTYNNIEIIIVDDGSSDNSQNICKEYALKDNRIKIYNLNHSGVSNARNFGISKSNGAYIGFVDSDDYISKDMYRLLLENCVLTNSDICICDVTRKCKELDIKRNKSVIEYSQEEYLKKYFKINSQTCEYYPVNKLYKRKVVSIKMFPEKYREGEDTFGVLKTVFSSNKICYIPEKLYFYRMNENSVTAKYSDTDLELICVWDDIIKFVSKTNKKYLEYAVLNRKRINFTLLMRMCLNVSIDKLKNDITAKKLLDELKSDEKYLLKSQISRDRKLLIYLFCRNYIFVAAILKSINKIKNRSKKI